MDSTRSEASVYPLRRHARLPARGACLFLGAYMLSQAFLIPVAPVGPAWVLWPTLSDIAILGLCLSSRLGLGKCSGASRSQSALLQSLVLISVLCLASYIVTVFRIGPAVTGKSLAIIDGAYNLFRLTQFIVLYALIIRIPLDEKRLRMLGIATDIAFLAVCSSVILTYLEIIPLSTLTAHLPPDPMQSGHWYTYAALDAYADVGKGLGTVSYSHAYGSVQILMLLALRLHLLNGRNTLRAAAYVLLALASTLLTESRAGLAATLLFAAIYSIRDPKLLIASVFMAVVALPFINLQRVEGTLMRQQTITDVTSDDNLSGRPRIWSTHLQSLADSPLHVLFGGGFGSARVNGNGSNAHMLYLQLLSECGTIGVILFTALAGLVLKSLYRHDISGRPIFWASIALLLSATTQETFYPQPALGHFIGLFLVSVGIALRSTHPPQMYKGAYGQY